LSYSRQKLKIWCDEAGIKPTSFKKNSGARDTPLYGRSVLNLVCSKHKALVDFSGLKQETSKQAMLAGFKLTPLLETIRKGDHSQRELAIAQLEEALPGIGNAFADQVATASHFMLVDRNNRTNIERKAAHMLAKALRCVILHHLNEFDKIRYAGPSEYEAFAAKMIEMYGGTE
jgi:hypothetical protein